MSVKRVLRVLLRFKFVLVFLILGLVFSHTLPPALEVQSSIDFNRLPELKVGDLVLRRGPDIESELIIEVSKGRYSHIGLIIQTSPTIKIIHATTNDDPSHANQVVITPIETFLAPKFSRAFRVLRPLFITEQMRHYLVKDSMQYLGEPFILTSRDQAPFYCSTYVFDVLRMRYPDFSLSWTELNLPVFQGEYLFPDAFLSHPQLQLVYVQE